jgi:hypothetical protein
MSAAFFVNEVLQQPFPAGKGKLVGQEAELGEGVQV